MRIRVEGDEWKELELAGIDAGQRCLSCKQPYRPLTVDGKINYSDPCVALCGIWRPVSRRRSRWRVRNKFDVHTPTCILGVRGTLLSVEISPDGEVCVTVAEGQVALLPRAVPQEYLPLASAETRVAAGRRCEVSAIDGQFRLSAGDPLLLAELTNWAEDPAEEEDQDDEIEALVVQAGPGVTRVKVTGAKIAEEPPPSQPMAIEVVYRGVRLRVTEATGRPGPAEMVRLGLSCVVENTLAQDAYISPAEEVGLLLDTGERVQVDGYRLATALSPGQNAVGRLEFVVPLERRVTGIRFGKGEAAAVVAFQWPGSPRATVSHEGVKSDE